MNPITLFCFLGFKLEDTEAISFYGVPLLTGGQPRASALLKLHSTIPLMLTCAILMTSTKPRTYSPLLDVDTDDCASWYDVHDNFLVYGGYGRKGALAANDVRSYRNYYYYLPRATYAGGNGPAWADNNGWFLNNSVVLSGAADPCGVPGGYASDCISVVHNHSFGMVTAGNTIMAANFETLEVPAWCSASTTVQQWIAKGHDNGTTVGPLPSLESVLSSARGVLGLPPSADN